MREWITLAIALLGVGLSGFSLWRQERRWRAEDPDLGFTSYMPTGPLVSVRCRNSGRSAAEVRLLLLFAVDEEGEAVETFVGEGIDGPLPVLIQPRTSVDWTIRLTPEERQQLTTYDSLRVAVFTSTEGVGEVPVNVVPLDVDI